MQIIQVNGQNYVVLTSGGERNYGSELGGPAAFAYTPEDWVRRDEFDSYSDFCDSVDAVGEDDDNWRELAIGLARHGIRLTIAGACTPALDDEEYLAVRAELER